MPRSKSEIADLLDNAHESLLIMARQVAGPGNEEKAEVEFYTDGESGYTLSELAAELRAQD
ncbi:hypothetical protein [Novosphingobium sp. TCA1]|uniref:hypothetical protein n=1 Tax=Novosphingobium sp. TCA1 TaxID=2682474 RepID=UPI00130AD6EB|nr:hypothetical protein [Novosphingobium sp. TCA1]GFE76263.1 hypothetical protein NTCA1_39120 [Novosphingobium sp. TCA1]